MSGMTLLRSKKYLMTFKDHGFIELIKLNSSLGTYFIHSKHGPVQLFGGSICWKRMDPNRHLCNAIASFPGGTYISDIDSSTEFPPFLLSVSPFSKAVVYVLLFKVK